MKTLKLKISNMLYFLLSVVFISSCTDAGTLESINKGNNDKIEILRYWYDDGSCVYIARFKDTSNLVTTNWDEQQGKTTVRRASVVLYENDSIQVLRK